MPYRSSREDRGNDLVDATLHLRIVGDAPGDGDLACTTRADALIDQLGGIDEDTCARSFFQAVFSEVSDLSAEGCEQSRIFVVATRFMLDDLRLVLFVRKIEFERDEALAGAVLEVFNGVLVTGVVRDDQ